MAFFTKAEILQRMKEKRAEPGSGARADVNLALLILGSALYEKRLKSGRDYGEHPVFVGFDRNRSVAKILIGLLHDLIEDSQGDWTLQDLRDVGFSARVVSGVDSMTKRHDELYFDFIERCSLNHDAVDLKIDDISHNLDESRSDVILGARDTERTNKYKISKAYLLAVKKGRIDAGSSIADFINNRDDFKNDLTVDFLLAKFSSKGQKPANDLRPSSPNAAPDAAASPVP